MDVSHAAQHICYPWALGEQPHCSFEYPLINSALSLARCLTLGVRQAQQKLRMEAAQRMKDWTVKRRPPSATDGSEIGRPIGTGQKLRNVWTMGKHHAEQMAGQQ